MNSDFKDLLRMFADQEVEYLVVGAYAVIHHSQPRYTKDLDLWIRPTPENARRVSAAFARFGVPLIEVTEEDFAEEGLQFAIGLPPSQIDFLTSLPGAPSFPTAWENRSTGTVDRVPVQFLGKEELMAAKRHAARPQDLADLEELGRTEDS